MSKFRPGDYLMISDISGREFFASEMVETWDKLWVHYTEADHRHPHTYSRPLPREAPPPKVIRSPDPIEKPFLYIPPYVGKTTIPYPTGPGSFRYRKDPGYRTGIGYWAIGDEFNVESG